MIEMLDHTADVGFELGASTLEELVEESRRALPMVAFERPPGEHKGILVRAAVDEARHGIGHRVARSRPRIVVRG